jgi:hypothetical protein
VSNQRAVLLKSDQFALVVDQFEVYPNGVHFRVMVHSHSRPGPQPVRNDDGSVSVTFSTSLPKEECHLDASSVGKNVIYYGLQLADGTKWVNIDRPQRPPDDATGPIVRSPARGGRSAEHWIWPLPPPGKIAFFAKWPKERLKEQTAEIDADELRALSGQATVIWPT